ncbi:MAG TPA: crotonase/enoyl-CoA hydratase family protein, partial [Solirubrobacteraceae bacterium]|nr:crotonase/enoyl-CoA hydratase family protein [Solirubrobacteraceae bacterium]
MAAAAPADAPVLTERRDGVLAITLNRPDARNAVNLAVAEGIAAALDELDGADELSVGVLSGAGKGFCAGMDLKSFVSGERPWVGDRGFAGIVRRPPQKPLIAAIEGFAVAGGLEIALACDLIVAARGAKLGVPEVKRSLVAAGGALLRLPRRIPYHAAMELALTGDPISAERAHELGLVNRLAEPGGAVETAIALAREIAVNAPLALIASKRILQEQHD